MLGNNSSKAGINILINLNSRFPGTYLQWQLKNCQPKQDCLRPCRSTFVAEIKTLLGKGGVAK
jgi:hypothetical protein